MRYFNLFGAEIFAEWALAYYSRLLSVIWTLPRLATLAKAMVRNWKGVGRKAPFNFLVAARLKQRQ